MKILQTISGLTAKSGGPSTCTRDLLGSLSSISSPDGKECKVDLLTVANPGNLGKGASWLKEVENDYKEPFFYSKNAREFMREGDYDIYHCNALWMGINHDTCKIAREKNKPYIISPHGMLYPTALKVHAWKKWILLNTWYKKDILNATCLHATCMQEAEHCRAFGYKGPIAVIPNPVVIPEFLKTTTVLTDNTDFEENKEHKTNINKNSTSSPGRLSGSFFDSATARILNRPSLSPCHFANDTQSFTCVDHKNPETGCEANATASEAPISACEQDSQTEISSSSCTINDGSQPDSVKNIASLKNKGDAEKQFGRKPLIKGRKQIGFLGRLHPIKKVENVIYAMDILNQQIKRGEYLPDTRNLPLDTIGGAYGGTEKEHETFELKDFLKFDIMGKYDDKYEHWLKEEVKRLGLEDCVEFVGFVSGKDKYKRLQNLSALMVPSVQENFGMIVPEALICGTPVYASLGTPWGELSEYDCGWWEDNKVETIAKVIKEILSLSEEELYVKGLNGRRLIEEKYEQHSVAAMMQQLYYWILNDDLAPNTKPDFVYLPEEAPLKVLTFITGIDLAGGGPSRSVPMLVKGLAEEDVDITLMTFRTPNMNTHALDGTTAKLKVWDKYTSMRKIEKYIVEEGFNLIQMQSLWSWSYHELAIIARKHNIPYIITPRGMLEPWSLSQKKWKKKLGLWAYQMRDMNNAACIYTTADMEAQHVRDLGVTAPISVIPNGIETENYPCRNSIDGVKKQILFLSRIHVKKGIEILMEAFAKIKEEAYPQPLPERKEEGCIADTNRQFIDNIKESRCSVDVETRKVDHSNFNIGDWSVVVVGNGEEEYIKSLKHKVKSLGMEDCFFIKDPVYGDAKVKLYQESSIFCLPSYSENFGMVIAEAMSCGVPVITTTNCPWDFLNETRTGWCIELSTGNLEQALREAMSMKPEELFEMGQRSSQLINDTFNYHSVAKKTKEMFEITVHKKIKSMTT